jgi:hypothetical protein
MFFPIPNPFSSKERRVTKSGSTDSLDRPFPKKGYASIFKQDKPVQSVKPVSPHCSNAHTIRMRGIA